MKKILLLLTSITLYYFTHAQCLNSNLSLVSVSGSGPYTITVQLCVGGGITGVTPGAGACTADYSIGYYSNSPISISSFSPASFTAPYNGNLVVGATIDNIGLPYAEPLYSFNTLAYYGSTQGDQSYQCITSTATCGNTNQHCINYTVVTNILPQIIKAFGVEGCSNPVAGCYGNTNMSIDLSSLPLKFTGLTATKQNSNVVLQWKTENEVNVKTIELERSMDGTTYNKIYSVAAKNQPLNNYSYTDAPSFINAAVLYYRLKQIDVDGRFTYSSIVTVKNKNSHTIITYPNPATDILFINGASTMYKTAQLINTSGQSVSLPVENNSVNIKTLPAGMYNLVLKTNKEVKTIKFLKQ